MTDAQREVLKTAEAMRRIAFMAGYFEGAAAAARGDLDSAHLGAAAEGAASEYVADVGGTLVARMEEASR